MDRSLLKRSFMIASNLATLLVNSLTLRVAIEIVCDISSNEENEIAFANLCDKLFCVIASGVEGKVPESRFRVLESVLRLLLCLVFSLLSLELLIVSEVRS